MSCWVVLLNFGYKWFSLKWLNIVAIFASAAFTLGAFTLPYWIQSHRATDSEFLNIGLWEVCFNQYTYRVDQLGQTYDGCFWVFDSRLLRLWDWIQPNWFEAFQAMVTISFIFSLMQCIVAFCIFLRGKQLLSRYWHLVIIGGLSGSVYLFMFVGMIIFVCRCFLQEWMPYPIYNTFSWGFAFAVMTLILQGFCMFLTTFMAQRERHSKLIQEIRTKDIYDEGNKYDNVVVSYVTTLTTDAVPVNPVVPSSRAPPRPSVSTDVSSRYPPSSVQSVPVKPPPRYPGPPPPGPAALGKTGGVQIKAPGVISYQAKSKPRYGQGYRPTYQRGARSQDRLAAPMGSRERLDTEEGDYEGEELEGSNI